MEDCFGTKMASVAVAVHRQNHTIVLSVIYALRELTTI